MVSYKTDVERFKESMLALGNYDFTRYVISAIETRRKLNYCDELPRYILEDACIAGRVLTLKFDNGTSKEIDFSKVIVKQCNSAGNKFELDEIGGNDYKIIIFNC